MKKIHNDEKIIIIAIVVCILVGLAGFSFAYYTTGAATTSGSTGKGFSVQTASNLNDVSINGGEAVTLENAHPGAKATKTFSVNVNNTNATKYTIKLQNVQNTFVKCNSSNKNELNNCTIGTPELTYTLKRGTTVIAENVDITESSGTIVLATETQKGDISYTLEITYVETNADQNHNMNKTFSGALKVEFSS